MNLTTHWVLAFALGIGFTHNIEVALILSIGALLPDLDREYLFVARDFIGRHQLHRAFFHNVFFIGLLYLLNPYLALGALSHTMLDTLTTATDRGVELFYPLTRLVRGHYYTIEGEQSEKSRKMTWWVEDTWRLLKTTSDRDLQEPDDQPWRRSYGPFRNSRIVDWAIFFASFTFLILVLGTFRETFYSFDGFQPLLLPSIAGIAVFYGLGEWYRRRIVKNLNLRKSTPELWEPLETNWPVLVILLFGVLTFFYFGYAGGLFLLRIPRLSNTTMLLVSLVSLVSGFIFSYILIKVWRADHAI